MKAYADHRGHNGGSGKNAGAVRLGPGGGTEQSLEERGGDFSEFKGREKKEHSGLGKSMCKGTKMKPWRTFTAFQLVHRSWVYQRRRPENKPKAPTGAR